MTCRSFCLMLTVALLIPAVHTPTPACGPGPQMPACTPPSVTGYPSAILPPAPAQPQVYYVPQPAPLAAPYVTPGASTWTLSVAGGKLHVLTNDGMRATCEQLTLLVSGVEPALATVAEIQIRIALGKDCKDADCLQATADRVTRSGADGALLTLEGNAKLLFVRKGKKVDVSADRVSVNLATGQVVSDLAPQPVPTVQPCSGPACPSTPAPVLNSTGTNAVGDSSWRVGYSR